MAPTFEHDEQREVWQAVQRINAAWLHGELEGLDRLLHARMVIVPPGFAQRIEGREACAEGYEQFARTATVSSYTESDTQVDVQGGTAVVSYRYDLTYALEGETYRDSGHDLYVLVHEDGRWQALWRTLMPALAEEA
jgi:uncharacterized protein (TIGR02246 family)